MKLASSLGLIAAVPATAMAAVLLVPHSAQAATDELKLVGDCPGALVGTYQVGDSASGHFGRGTLQELRRSADLDQHRRQVSDSPFQGEPRQEPTGCSPQVFRQEALRVTIMDAGHT